MKKQIYGYLAACSCLTMVPAFAGEDCLSGFYLGAFGGVDFLPDEHKGRLKLEFNPGCILGVEIGYKFNKWCRLEGEYAYRRNKVEFKKSRRKNHKLNSHVDTTAFMVNGYWDIDFDSCIVPYLGIGLGCAWHESEKYDTKIRFTSKGVAEQCMAGVKYQFNNNTSIGMEYRYFCSKTRLNDHSAIVKLNYVL